MGRDVVSVRIAPRVLATIVKLTTLAVPGVVRLVEKGRFGRPSGGMRLRIKDSTLSVEVYVVVDRTTEMMQVCSRAQNDILHTIDKMVGIPVAEVNVFVQDVE